MTGAAGTTSSSAPDLGQLLGITGIGAKVLVVLYWLNFLSLAIFSGGEPMQTAEGWIALALMLTSAVLLVLPWRYPLPMPLVVTILVFSCFATVAICWHLDPITPPGYTSWNFGAVTFLMYMVALRGRVAAATVGMALMTGLTIQWTVATSGDWTHGFFLVDRQFFSFVAVAFFAVWLRRTAQRIALFHAAQRSRVAEEQATTAAADERRRRLEQVRKIAGPALNEIARGGLDAGQREEHRLIEAQLRDSIRGRALASTGLLAAARAARRRGVDVAIIDDLRDEVSASIVDEAIVWAADLLSRVRSGDVTVRLARFGNEPAVTFATGEGMTATFRSPEAAPATADRPE